MRHLAVFALVSSAVLLQGCSLFVSVPPLVPLAETRKVLADVHYTPQENDWDCGPACLATMMRYHGSSLTLDQVKSQLKQTRGGTIMAEMIYGARKNGFRAAMVDGNINELRRMILAGKPVILMLHPLPDIVRYIGRRGHYVVAVGYDDERRQVIIHSGTRAFDTISYRQLQLQWSRASFLALLVEK